MKEAAQAFLVVTCEQEKRVGVVIDSKRIERHRKSSLGPFSEPGGRNSVQLRNDIVVEVGDRGQLGGVSGFFETRHRLTNLADRAAFETERGRIDDCLVTDVEGSEAE